MAQAAKTNRKHQKTQMPTGKEDTFFGLKRKRQTCSFTRCSLGCDGPLLNAATAESHVRHTYQEQSVCPTKTHQKLLLDWNEKITTNTLTNPDFPWISFKYPILNQTKSLKIRKMSKLRRSSTPSHSTRLNASHHGRNVEANARQRGKSFRNLGRPVLPVWLPV